MQVSEFHNLYLGVVFCVESEFEFENVGKRTPQMKTAKLRLHLLSSVFGHGYQEKIDKGRIWGACRDMWRGRLEILHL